MRKINIFRVQKHRAQKFELSNLVMFAHNALPFIKDRGLPECIGNDLIIQLQLVQLNINICRYITLLINVEVALFLLQRCVYFQWSADCWRCYFTACCCCWQLAVSHFQALGLDQVWRNCSILFILDPEKWRPPVDDTKLYLFMYIQFHAYAF